MRLREIPLTYIAPLGVAAALVTHVSLQAVAGFGVGARDFSEHAHAAFEPAVFVEIALAVWLVGRALRDALTGPERPYYALASRPRLSVERLGLSACLIGAVASATLFGMEYAETGSAALGLGWLGGQLIPGAIALLAGITAAVVALHALLAGQLAGFDHLVAFFAAALARLAAILIAPAPVPQRISARRLTTHAAPVARHAGLRAPPRTTR